MSLPPSGPFQRDEALLFLHLPKTAGISMSMMLTDQFAADEIYHIREESSVRSPVFAEQYGGLNCFKELTQEQRNRFRLILGHMHFGLHELLDRPCSYFTVLRDPVERVISSFGQHNRAKDKESGLGNFSPMTFEEFCRLNPGAVDNLQTRMLCGGDFQAFGRRNALEKAKENLSTWCRVIGTQERFQETVVLLQEIYGLGQMVEKRRNIGTHRPPEHKIDGPTRGWIEEQNILDRELYQYADALLTRRIQAFGREKFQQRLEEYRRFLAEDARLALLAEDLRLKSRKAIDTGMKPVRGVVGFFRRGLGWFGLSPDPDGNSSKRGAA